MQGGGTINLISTISAKGTGMPPVCQRAQAGMQRVNPLPFGLLMIICTVISKL